MKTKKTFIITSLLALFCVAAFFSCENPISLGPQLDINGPIVGFTSPAPRTAVSLEFEIKGTVSDSSSIETLLLKASLNNEELSKQWRYTRNSGWQVSENYGASWNPVPSAGWEGEKSVTWTVPIDMSVSGKATKDGEYTFTVQAWDTGGFSDDNSLKSLVLIYDTDPPKVEVFNPPLYSRYVSYYPGVYPDDGKFGFDKDGNEVATDKDGKELQSLRDKSDWREPSLLGKFLTQEFLLQWQIEDNHDIASIEIRFYEHDVVVDNIPETEIPDNYIYSYKGSNSPNGSVWVPNLSGPARTYNEIRPDGGIIGGEIKAPVPSDEKTTIKVVALCYDMANHVNQEKGLGYFLFWPEAAKPWIEFTNGMQTTKHYEEVTYTTNEDFEDDSFMIYPGRSIKSTAYQAQGASRVEYSLHEYDFTTKTVNMEPITLSYLKDGFKDELNAQGTAVTARNSLRPNGSYSTIFPWEFTPPPKSGYYAIRATAYDFNGTAGEVYEFVFRVQDITFPDFPEPPQPSASIPLFKSIQDNKITISGIVSDATEVVSLYLVWINPESKSYAAMSQLSYFRNAKYTGWEKAIEANLQGDSYYEEEEYDDGHPNKVWKVPVTYSGEDPQTFRQIFSYSQTIDITDHLNIAGTNPANSQPLTSQVFLLRAENPNKKCTIITYAPQGDTAYPTIKIDRVEVSRGTAQPTVCLPGEYQQVSQFQNNDRIRVHGSWTEDSTEILPIDTYLTPNVKFEINRTPVTGTLSPATGNAVAGTFLIDVTVGNQLAVSTMKDTLAVSATIRDIGGNPAEVANSWLIESDTLKFLRISSERDDGAYRAGTDIDIFIEFNKAVMLKTQTPKPVLMLNTGGIAVYKDGQTTESPRQYFTYQIGANHNTPVDSAGNPTQYLNVTGISTNGGTSALTNNDTTWQNAAYPFTWENTTMSGTKDEIRLTTISTHNNTQVTNYPFIARVVPVTTTQTDPDYMFTLGGGKRIEIDNRAPQITSFSASPQGWHRAEADIYITATFNKNVQKGTGTGVRPRLTLTGGVQTTDNDSDIRVNNNQITFRYTVASTDNTAPNQLQVTNFTGQILDIPGTPMEGNAVTSMTGQARTLTGVYLDNNAPSPPQVTVHRASPGESTQIPVTKTLYNDAVWIEIVGASGPENLGRIEYTLNGNNNSLTTSTAVNNPIQLTNQGSYTIRARQIDQAGNTSTFSNDITFTRDSGNLVTRISSTKPNGLYTHNSNFGNGNSIPITIYFRKPVTVTAVSGITLNAVTGNPGTAIVLNNTTSHQSPAPINLPITGTELTFNYIVQNETGAAGSNNGDRTPAGTYLNLIIGNRAITAKDADDVDVTDFILMPAANQSLRLGENKQITVESGALTTSNANHTFIADNQGGTGYDNETSANFHGIRSDDGSYWTTLQIVFNHTINKGTGNITIEQSAGDGATAYRLPIVLTESQYNRFRGVNDFDAYYEKGTNGYLNAQNKSDTSTKYVLKYTYNPNIGRTGAAFNGDTLPDTAFFTGFRTAEKITVNVNSQAVTIVNNNTLRIRLSGSNAPQVPGAIYHVSYPVTLVTDNLGNSLNAAGTDVPVTLRGVAKPYVRIKKTQDTITGFTAAAAATPTVTATQPLHAYVRMDTRTPGSSIVYRATDTPYTATASNWNDNTNANPGPHAVTAATRPADPTGGTTYVSQPNPQNDNLYGIRIGPTTYGGHKWWVRAIATATVGGTSYTSRETEEMAYRTAITYRINNMTAPGNTTAQQVPRAGNQIWIRGGDSLGSSSIPGFPFTWEDDWVSLKANGKRAGIRLMTKTGNENLTNATWQFMTWEINATAYIDFILGLENNETYTANANQVTFTRSVSINEVWQYGPKYFASQRAGWTALKSLYPVYPGEIRYCDTGTNLGGNTAVNFSAAYNSRPYGALSGSESDMVTHPTPNTNN